MPDTWGVLPIPTATPAAGESAGDPLLQRLLDYLVTFLKTDANATIAWAAISKDRPNVVVKAYPHDPTIAWFNDNELPALFLHRSEIGRPRQIAQDWRIRPSTLTLRWIFQSVAQDRQRARLPYMNALVSAIDIAIERGRTPSFILPGETEAQAAYLGSLVYDHLGIYSITHGRARFELVQVEAKEAGVKPLKYPSLSMEILIEEKLGIDLTRWDPFDGGVSGQMTGGEAPQIQTEDFLFDLVVTGVSPTTGTAAGGTAITITGSSFMDGAVVELGGVACTSIVVVGPTTITAVTPAHATGLVACVVTNPSTESYSLPNAFTFT